MMGLQTRLKLARTMVWVGLQTNPQELARLVGQLCAGQHRRGGRGAAGRHRRRPADRLPRGLQAGDGRTIIRLAGDANQAKKVKADLVAQDAALPPVRAHEHALSVAVASDARELERALADDAVAVVVTAGLVQMAGQLAPPERPDSKPWFAQAQTLAEGRELIAAGARRLALESPAITAEQDLGMGPDAVVGAYRDVGRKLARRDDADRLLAEDGRTMSRPKSSRGRRAPTTTGEPSSVAPLRSPAGPV